MRFFKKIFIVLIVTFLFYVAFDQDFISFNQIDHFIDSTKQEKDGSTGPQFKQEPKYEKLSGEVFTWIGKDKNDLYNEFGKPIREEPSAYGYDWYIYANHTGQYIQFGLENEKIVTLFATGTELQMNPLDIGMSYSEVKNHFAIENELSFSKDLFNYTFRLNEDDITTRPMVQLADDVFLQLYFDIFTDDLTAIRLLNKDTLLLQLPYEIIYQGQLPERPKLSQEEWREVEHGMETQIFEISNVIRYMHEIPQLEWDEQVSEVAYMHSKDMLKNEYFSHERPDGTGLKERLLENEIIYQAAGENIAAEYSDAPDATLGWLNSEGHREALLNKKFSHLGVGVYERHYTQNFLTK